MKTCPIATVLFFSFLTCACSAIRAAPEHQAYAPSAVHHAAVGKTDAAGLRHSYDACLDASAGADAAVQTCISTEYVYQDARLNTIYEALMSKLPQAGQAKLRTEERKWITYRDSTCKLAPGGGQGQRLESNDCSVEQTAKRATALDARQP